MYCRYFCRLHSISSKPGSLLSLCALYETLIIHSVPEVAYHLLKLHVQPLKIAFPWIVRAFVTVLPSDQVLLLWDRVIGFDSCEYVFLINSILNSKFERRKFKVNFQQHWKLFQVICDNGCGDGGIPVQNFAQRQQCRRNRFDFSGQHESEGGATFAAFFLRM